MFFEYFEFDIKTSCQKSRLLGQGVDGIEVTDLKDRLQLIKMLRCEDTSTQDCQHRCLDGGLIGPASLGIPQEGDELGSQGVHGQTDHRLLTDGSIQAAGHQSLPEGEVVRRRRRQGRRGEGLITLGQPGLVLSPGAGITSHSHQAVIINAANDGLVLI